MASISSLMGSSSSSSSIYGSRNTNIISGLASGLDTESLIEGMVESYKQKITSLQQDRTKLQWQQEAYQSISNKLVEFSRKYTSFTSTTNLLSNSFFNNSVITSTGGKYADLVTATGKSNSDISILGVAQLASAARYQTTAASLGADGVTAKGSSVDLSEKMLVSNMTGTLSISYNGNEEITVEFEETDDLFDEDGNLDMDKFQKVLEEKLADQQLTDKNGDKVSAAELIDVEISTRGGVALKTKGDAVDGASVLVSGASGDFAGVIRDLESVTDKSGSFQIDMDAAKATVDGTKAEYLSGKTFSVTLNGQTKKITLGKITGTDNDAVVTALQEALNKSFGDGRITVEDKDGVITFSGLRQGDTFSVSSSEAGVSEMLFGEGNSSVTNYLDVSKSLGQLGGLEGDTLTFGGMQVKGTIKTVADKSEIVAKDDGTYTDKNGNLVDKDGNYLAKDGETPLYEFTMSVNGEDFTFTQDTALETVMNSINSNAEAGVNVSYSKITNKFVFTAKDSGEAGRIEIGGDLGTALFGTVDTSNKDTYTAGQDAVFQAKVNGQTQIFTRSENTFDMDGLTVTLEGVFNNADRGADAQPIQSSAVDEGLFVEGEAVTFSTKTDTDTIVDAIKQMVEDYNAIVTEVKKAYSDMPLQQSNGSQYEPLTSDDEEGMTDSEIEAYEEKAKTGILFMDSDLSSLYSSLRSAVVPGGSDGSYLRSIGIQTSYEDGLTTISLDESALREALENDLDGVRDAFTKSKENGAATDGLMTSIQKVTDKYAATTGAVKGILIEKAGSQYAPTAALDNTMLNKMEEIDVEIEKWQDKMSDKVDYYTNKFTQLELLINQMNSQSSTLSGLTSG